jgi:phosphoglycerate dehydrogenase-like enzyme
MSGPTVVFAGHEFPAAPAMLASAFEGATIAVVDRDVPAMHSEVLVPLMARIDGAVMDRVAGLRLIQQWGAGLEGVDISAATDRCIAVGNVASTESGNAEAVAEWCVMAALALGRKLGEIHDSIREGRSWGSPIGQSLAGSTAGIVGLGGIGTALARRLGPFGVDVIGVTARPDPSRAAELGLSWLKGPGHLGELLARADYLFLCLPLRPGTHQLLDASAIETMRPGSFVINPGRGGLIDEPALTAALASGRLAGAALDVFATEPLDPRSPLLTLPSVLATPHIAGVTNRSYQGNATRFVGALYALSSSQPLVHCLNWPLVADSFYANA